MCGHRAVDGGAAFACSARARFKQRLDHDVVFALGKTLLRGTGSGVVVGIVYVCGAREGVVR